MDRLEANRSALTLAGREGPELQTTPNLAGPARATARVVTKLPVMESSSASCHRRSGTVSAPLRGGPLGSLRRVVLPLPTLPRPARRRRAHSWLLDPNEGVNSSETARNYVREGGRPASKRFPDTCSRHTVLTACTGDEARVRVMAALLPAVYESAADYARAARCMLQRAADKLALSPLLDPAGSRVVRRSMRHRQVHEMCENPALV